MKVHKKKKVSKMKTTTVVNPTSQQIPPDAVNTPQSYNSLIGQICVYVRESITNPPQSHFARVVSQLPKAPTRVPVNVDGSVDRASYVAFWKSKVTPTLSEERSQYLEFCTRAGIDEPCTFRVCQSQDEKTYNHYAAYYTKIDVESPLRERWERIKDDGWLWNNDKAEFHLIHRKPFDRLLCVKTTRLSNFSVMMKVQVGVRDTSSCDPIKSFETKDISRVVTVAEAESRYYSPSQQVLQLRVADEFFEPEFRGATLYPITLRCEQEPACWSRPIERPITFDKHLARVAYRPSLQGVNEIELTPFKYRNRVKINSIVDLECKPENRIAHKSLWCKKCNDYVSQNKWDKERREYVWQKHDCPPNCDAGQVLYYTTARALQKAHQLLLAAKQRHKREHLHSVLEFMYLNLTVNTILPHKSKWFRKQVVSLLRKAAWDKSVVVFKETDPIKHKVVWVASDATQRANFNDRVVVCDPDVFRQAPSTLFVGVDHRNIYIRKNERRCREAIVVDYLPVPRCRHSWLKSFSFLDGEKIEMCPDCSNAFTSISETLNAFDRHRRAVSMSGSVDTGKPVDVALWGAQLSALDLSMSRGTLPILTDHIEELSNKYSHRVNTAGSAGTEREGNGNDSSARDRRAKRWLAEQQGKQALTQSLCWHCCADIYDRGGDVQSTNFCPDTDCRQRFQEDWDKGLKEDLLRTGMRLLVWQDNDSLIKLWKQISQNRS